MYFWSKDTANTLAFHLGRHLGDDDGAPWWCTVLNVLCIKVIVNERVHSEPDFRNSPRASTPYMLYFPTMSKENVSLECRPITAFCPLLAGVLRIYLDNYGIMLIDAATVTIPTYLGSEKLAWGQRSTYCILLVHSCANIYTYITEKYM